MNRCICANKELVASCVHPYCTEHGWDEEKDAEIAQLRADVAEAKRERDEEGRLRTEWGALYTDMVRQRDDWHEAAHAADERAAVSSELREAAETERDTMRAKLAERDRYIAEQRAITEPSVQDLARQLREATERTEKAERLLGHVYDQLIKDGRLTDALGMILNEVGATVTLYGTEHPTYEALRSRCEIAEAAVARMKHLHRTKPDEALDRATIRRVAEDDGLVHSADVLRLLADVEKAEQERDEARGDLKHELVERSIVEQELRAARQERDEAEDEAAVYNAAATQREKDIYALRTKLVDAERRIAEVELERDVSRSALNSIVSELRDALGDFPMVGEKWTDAVKRLRAKLADAERRLAEVKRKRDAASFDAEAQKIRARAAEERLAEVELERDDAASEAAAHNAAATQYEKDIADLRAKLADAERRIAELSPTTKDACLDTALTEK